MNRNKHITAAETLIDAAGNPDIPSDDYGTEIKINYMLGALRHILDAIIQIDAQTDSSIIDVPVQTGGTTITSNLGD
jgi:hypothetical protein